MIDPNIYILHIETSTRNSSIALSRGDEVMAFRELKEGMNHTALLAPAIEGLLKDAGVEMKHLSAVSVSSGPGSYTGLRVGTSTGKAMAYALRIPLLEIPTLKSLAYAAFKKHPEAKFAMPMIDARRNEVYTAIYDTEYQEHIPSSSLLLNDHSMDGILPVEGKTVICGDGAMKVDGTQTGNRTVIDTAILTSALHLIEPALTSYDQHDFRDAMHFVPFYMKPPNITKPRNRV